MTKAYKILLVGIISTFISNEFTYSQVSLSFSSDTVSVEACDSFPSPMGIITVYNNTANTITLNWEETNTIFPTTGSTALIIDPIQFPANSSNGSSWVDGNDTTDILFHIWPDSMLPGDTSLFQIVVYDPADSVNTAKILTAFIYCSIAAQVDEYTSSYSMNIFPNPLSQESTVLINYSNSDPVKLMIFDMEGKLIQELTPINGKAIIEGKKLIGGMYFIQLMKEGQVLVSEKLIVN